jgi:23S rRNA (guanosine2251-2'-O)-methyltransferase
MKKELIIIAHNIRSAHNVGAILRTADGAGVSKVYLTGYTAAPFRKGEDKYETSAHKMISKTALGAEDFISWEKEKNILTVLKKLKKRKFQIVALEIDKESKNIFKFKFNFPCAIILGNEIGGVEQGTMKKCDGVVSIQMRGKKESLNVSVASGIAIYQILK